MQILGIILLAYGAFVMAGLFFQFPLFYNNPKSKMLIKMMGRNGYNILLLVFGLAGVIGGIIILS